MLPYETHSYVPLLLVSTKLLTKLAKVIQTAYLNINRLHYSLTAAFPFAHKCRTKGSTEKSKALGGPEGLRVYCS